MQKEIEQCGGGSLMKGLHCKNKDLSSNSRIHGKGLSVVLCENLLLLPRQPTSPAAPQLEVEWRHAQLSRSSLSMPGCGLTRACTDIAFVVTATLRSNVQLLCHAQKTLFLCSHQPSRCYILSSLSLQWFLNPEGKGCSNCVLHRDKQPTVLQSAILYTLTGAGSLC